MRKSKENQTTTGKRKRAIARVRLRSGDGKVTVNGKSFEEYFGARGALKKKFSTPFELTGNIDKLDAVITVKGGGKVGQADAVANAISKALASHKETNRKNLKAAGLLTRDSRIKESKKYGHKKARKRFQYSKR